MKKKPLLVELHQRHATLRQARRLSKWSAAVLLALASVAFGLRAGHAAGEQVNKERLLHKACHLIEQEDADLSDLQQGVDLLLRHQDKFAADIRFPICLARAYYRMGDPDSDSDPAYSYYEKVGLYAKMALEMDPARAEGHYWYGLYLLKKAQNIGGLPALFIVKEGIQELEMVRKTLPQYDHAGASRVLGVLHCRAPLWTPFGNIDECVALAEEAVRLAPDHGDNRLYLAEAYRKRAENQAQAAQNDAPRVQSPNTASAADEDMLREVLGQRGPVCPSFTSFDRIPRN